MNNLNKLLPLVVVFVLSFSVSFALCGLCLHYGISPFFGAGAAVGISLSLKKLILESIEA